MSKADERALQLNRDGRARAAHAIEVARMARDASEAADPTWPWMATDVFAAAMTCNSEDYPHLTTTDARIASALAGLLLTALAFRTAPEQW